MAGTARNRIARILQDGFPSVPGDGYWLDSDSLRISVAGFDRGGGSARTRVPPQIGDARGRRLIALAEPVRFTTPESAYPDAWEIPLRLVTVEWVPGALRGVLAAARKELGLPDDCGLAVEPRSLFILEPGQYIPLHQEPEPSGGLLGGLTVSLPTRCSGGDVLIDDHGTGHGPGHTMRVRVFHGGCISEVTRVRSGYRVVLTFSLRLSGKDTQPEADMRIIAETASLLREYFASPSDNSGNRRFAYLLDGVYGPGPLQWSRLSASDACRAAVLRAAADRAGCEAVLARADIAIGDALGAPVLCEDDEEEPYIPDEEAFYEDEYYWEEPEPERYERTVVTAWTEQDGGLMDAVSLRISEAETCASIRTDDPASHGWRLETDEPGSPRGSEQRYRRAAVVVWPRDRGLAIRAEASPGWALHEVVTRALSGDLSGARSVAAAVTSTWGRDGQDPRCRVPLTLALTAARAVEDSRAASLLLRPYQIEDLRPADTPVLGGLMGSHGSRWSADLLANWFPRRERTADRRAGHLRWIAGQLIGTCAGLHAAGNVPEDAARLLLGYVWTFLVADIEEELTTFPAAGDRCGHFNDLGGAVAAVLAAASAISAEDIRDQGCGYLLRQPSEIATALELPVLHTLGDDGRPGLDELAADCAARIRDRLALTRDVSRNQPATAGGLTTRERQARDRDTADLKWLTVRWHLAA